MGQKQENDGGRRLVSQQVITQEDLAEARKREEQSGTAWYRHLLQMKKLNFDAVHDVLQHEFHSKADRKSHMMLGQALVKAGRLSEEQLREALREQKKNGKLIGTILLDKKMVSSETIARALADRYSLDYVNATETPSDQAALDFVPQHMARQKKFIPLRLKDDKLTVLISGPQATERMKHIGILLGVRVATLMTSIEDMNEEVRLRYGGAPLPPQKEKARPKRKNEPPKKTSAKAVDPPKRPREPKSKPKKTQEPQPMEANHTKETSRFGDIAQEAQGVPVVRLVSTIIEGAANSGATDIHLDPQDPEMRVRYRIDGVLHDVMSIAPDVESAVVSRVKILADIDITETRHPQDGHIRMDIGESEFDIRVATLPTYLGERVVLRLLDQSSVLTGVGDLGMEADDEKKLIDLIEQPYGMVLVTGPTGSGKTTTLYSCLNQINVMTDSIVTLEDPVEYQLSGINQVQIETDIDLTFSSVLRAALRQDIDVLLVGEIRDPDTARIAIRAAMTGHLVFSTLHTNDAPEAITTLRNMDIPSYLISSALTAIIAQRLVRLICPECKTHFSPTKSLLKSIGLPDTTKRLYRGKGCDICYNTGTHGRTGIFEVLEVDQNIRRLIGAKNSAEEVTKAAKLKTMADRCRLKVKNGLVTPEEFLRVIRT